MIFKRPMKGVSLLPPHTETTDENILAAMEKLRYPVHASIKMDGIRAVRLKYNGKDELLSYRLKLIPNKSIRERAMKLPHGFDMELWCPYLPYNDIESIVMSEEHSRSYDIQFHILDWITHDGGYWQRCSAIRHWQQTPFFDVFVPPFQEFTNAKSLFLWFLTCESQGCEGICFRTPDSPYKQGRSTLKEQWLVKLCRWSYEETKVINFTEQMENTNDEKYNGIGLMDRSKTLSGQEGKNTLGAFVCEGGFSVGTGVGLTDKLRQYIWDNRSEFIGCTIKYKCKPHGQKDNPRSPILWGFRDTKID